MLDSSFKEEIKESLQKNCLLKGTFILSSGKKSDYIINCKPLMLSPYGHYLLGHCLKNELPSGTKAVAGYGLGGYALASAVSYASITSSESVSALYIRKVVKNHGTQSLIEGIENTQKGDLVVVLEDVVTTGQSVLKAVKILKSAGYNVECVVSIVDREEGAGQILVAKGLKFISLFKATELLE